MNIYKFKNNDILRKFMNIVGTKFMKDFSF